MFGVVVPIVVPLEHPSGDSRASVRVSSSPTVSDVSSLTIADTIAAKNARLNGVSESGLFTPRSLRCQRSLENAEIWTASIDVERSP
jgi:hypothetical protein